ncbi:hypothetical protein [Nocardioides sp. 503]|uniref:hypothetical protein n=1 Tax=Nocardioides sp. 503 TaxID=2508326 RepID=UPI001431F4EA|nr:hypothetical protein [Nocardioides sp. 503]
MNEPSPACPRCLDASVVLTIEDRDLVYVPCPDCAAPATAPAETSTPAAGAVLVQEVPC